jgi:hypothetical protein
MPSGRSRLATVTGLHAEHAARLLHDDLHGARDVQARRDRAAGLQKRPRLARPPLALLEELGVLDGDPRLLAESLQTLRGTHSMARIPSCSSTSRRAERGSVRMSLTRMATPLAAQRPLMPSPTGIERARQASVLKP